MTGTIALTGATGFIGAAVARRLAVDGWQVRALVRRSSPRMRWTEFSGEWVEGDLQDEDSLRRLVVGAEAVVHCAGAVRGASRNQFNSVNVDGVARLVRAGLAQHRVPRFLLMSSLAAREEHLSSYASSKRDGERALAEAAGEMEWIALRPPAVYGPGDREILPLFRWIERGIAPVLGSSSARFSLLYVEDLAEAVVRWLECRNHERAAFELHDGQPHGYSWNDLVATAARVCARRVLRVPVPPLVLHLAGGVNLAAATIFGYSPMLTTGKVRELRHPDWVCDNAALNRATGWGPRVGLEEGLRRTLEERD